MFSNDARRRFQVGYGLNRLRLRAGEALAGARPEQWSEISQAAVDDVGVRIEEDVPAVPKPDQIVHLVIYNQPWQQAAGQPAESEDLASGRSSQVKEPLVLQEPRKEDEGEVLPCLIEGKRPAWGWRLK